MADARSYILITHRSKDQLILGFSWRIVTQASVVISKRVIDTKTTCFQSLTRHAKRYFGINLPTKRHLVKNMEVTGLHRTF